MLNRRETWSLIALSPTVPLFIARAARAALQRHS